MTPEKAAHSVRRAAAALFKARGLGNNRSHMKLLRDALEAAAAEVELEERRPDVRSGELASDDPIWREGGNPCTR